METVVTSCAAAAAAAQERLDAALERLNEARAATAAAAERAQSSAQGDTPRRFSLYDTSTDDGRRQRLEAVHAVHKRYDMARAARRRRGRK